VKAQFCVDSHRTKHAYAWARLVARDGSSKAHYGFPIPLLPCLRRPPASALPLLPTPSRSPRRARTTVERSRDRHYVQEVSSLLLLASVSPVLRRNSRLVLPICDLGLLSVCLLVFADLCWIIVRDGTVMPVLFAKFWLG
jgi:hypothetical protein